jgi:hypothetical protein
MFCRPSKYFLSERICQYRRSRRELGIWEWSDADVSRLWQRRLFHTGKDIYGIKYSIKPDSTFVYKFAARVGSRTIREWGNGVVVISAGFITFKFEQGASERYKFVSLTKDLKGATTLSVVQIGGGDQRLKCGHSISYFDCLGTQDWMLRSGTQQN